MAALFLVFDTIDKLLESVKMINFIIFIMLYYLFKKPDKSVSGTAFAAASTVGAIYGAVTHLVDNPHYAMKTILVIVVAFLIAANLFLITALIVGLFNDLVIRRKRGPWFITTMILLAILYMEIIRIYGK